MSVTDSPTLIVMAAGMGSRYGGLKQIDPITEHGEIIMDFSLYDAIRAGFGSAVFIIKKEMEDDMRALMDAGASRSLDIRYAYQEIEDTPSWFSVPEDRVKPWGTGHAVLAARSVTDGPFAVINSDDYYGPGAYRLMREYLANATDDDVLRYAMVGYRLANTVTEHGSVARGICGTDVDGYLTGVDERLKVERRGGSIAYEAEDGSWVNMPPDTIVSMNFWGFTESFMDELSDGLSDFFANDVPRDPCGSEYLLPRIVDSLVRAGRASVKVMNTDDRWYGVTYREDKDKVAAAFRRLKSGGLYPERLWG
ncbi:MAG: nucleotidyltransferase [Clostridiales Family XIII bacterium]|jgi:NDP-sugar pyrophosphorylase family protein|nr:nucleotidyltransferase [Clostridiales Family XIII bacterium]